MPQYRLSTVVAGFVLCLTTGCEADGPSIDDPPPDSESDTGGIADADGGLSGVIDSAPPEDTAVDPPMDTSDGSETGSPDTGSERDTSVECQLDGDCDDELDCTIDECTDDGTCRHEIESASCLVDGECWGAGDIPPKDRCATCDPDDAVEAWTTREAGWCGESDGYWAGVAADVVATPEGKGLAVACHNCYVDDPSQSASENLQETLDEIHRAQRRGADSISLDVVWDDGVLRAQHDSGGSYGPKIEDVLADEQFRRSDQMLGIELKEGDVPEAYVDQLLELVDDYDFAVAGRPVSVAAFRSRREHLVRLVEALDDPTYQHLADHVSVTELFKEDPTDGDISQFQDWIDRTADDGFDAVMLNHQSSNFFAKSNYAHEKGLGVGVWTIPESHGEVFVAALRNDLEFLTTDLRIDRTRQVIERDDRLVYFDATEQSPNYPLEYRRGGGRTANLDTSVSSSPSVRSSGTGEPLYGTWLEFDGDAGQSVSFGNPGGRSGDGFLVSAVVTFDSTSVGRGEVQGIVSKADGAEFAIEIYNSRFSPVGETTRLRFGVRVDGEYVYSKRATALMSSDQSYFLVGAYDGDGGVYLWVDNDPGWDSAPSTTGAVERNKSPIVAGADPEGADDRRFFFDGGIQKIQVLDWGK